MSVTQQLYRPPVEPSLYPEYPDDSLLPGEMPSERKHIPSIPIGGEGELTVVCASVPTCCFVV
jgi:hypothetical protein